MIIILWLFILLTYSPQESSCELDVLTRCHFDPEPVPKNGLLGRGKFDWLAVMEFLHIKNGTKYIDAVPRVNLIHQQFAITTASVVMNVPHGYSLGNVVIVEYVLDEKTCGLSNDEILQGKVCSRASYVVPIDDVIVHPEYMSFGAPESVAILKLIRRIESKYFMPVCLPNSPVWNFEMTADRVYLLDFFNARPDDYEYERKAFKRIHVTSPYECDSYELSLNVSKPWRERVLCTSGCGFRAGSPLLAHHQRKRIGKYWHLVGIALGGPACMDPSERHRRNKIPGRFLYVWPYVQWIVELIMSHINPYPLPNNFRKYMPQSYAIVSSQDGSGYYEGLWYTKGQYCTSFKYYKQPLTLVYEDLLLINPITRYQLNYIINVRVDIRYTVGCIKVWVRNRLLTPKSDNWGGYNITLYLPNPTLIVRKFFMRILMYAYEESWTYKNFRHLSINYMWYQNLKKLQAEGQ